MVHGYHVIMPMYGFWLPNDPRGSWSDYVRRWEIARFGRCQRTSQRRAVEELTPSEVQQRDKAKAALTFPEVAVTGDQARTIGNGFGNHVRSNNYTIWACAILPTHTHMVIARHSFKVEIMANLLKGASTTAMIRVGNHPFGNLLDHHGRPQRMWSAHQWKVYLNSEAEIDEAIGYVEANPEKEGKPKQSWRFVMPFPGIDRGGWTIYH